MGIVKSNSISVWAAMVLQMGMLPALSVPVPSARPHPGFDNYNILPAGWDVGQDKSIGGIALLPDGRMVTTIWRGGAKSNRNGEAYLLSGVLNAKSSADVSVAQISKTLFDPLGVTVVNGTIYVLEKDRLAKFTPNGSAWTYAMEYDGANPFTVKDFYHWFSMGLVYHKGKFNWTLGGFTQYSEFVDPEPMKHGTWVQYDPATKTHEFLVHGLRNTGGVALGPEGTICTTDNQGEWEPANKFICMEPGKWYGWDGPNALARMGRPETPPTVWNTYADLGNSPGQAILMPKGKYAGQMLLTDLPNAWITRLSLEKVKGHWQGANIFLTGGFQSGVFRILLAPDSSSLIVAGVGGNGGGWKYGTTYTSLHRLVPNTKSVLEILTVRSLGAGQMSVEFTDPVGGAAASTSSYTVTSWKNIANSGYGGGHKVQMKTHAVTAVSMTPDNRRSVLSITGLEEGRIVRIEMGPAVKAISGDTLWSKFADYTLNNFGPAEVVTLARMVEPSREKPFQYAVHKTTGGMKVEMASPGAYELEILSPEGKRVDIVRKTGPFGFTLSRDKLGVGLFILNIRNSEGSSAAEKINLN